MSTLKKVGFGFLILLVVILADGFTYVHHLATRGIPDYDRNLVLDGLISEVTVYRDENAVPHMYAQNEHDL